MTKLRFCHYQGAIYVSYTQGALAIIQNIIHEICKLRGEKKSRIQKYKTGLVINSAIGSNSNRKIRKKIRRDMQISFSLFVTSYNRDHGSTILLGFSCRWRKGRTTYRIASLFVLPCLATTCPPPNVATPSHQALNRRCGRVDGRPNIQEENWFT